MATLSESVEAILDAIVEMVQDSVDDSGSPLADDGVVAVVRGDRARPMPKLPAIWVVPQPAQMSQDAYGDETWTMRVSLAAIVKSDQPEEGGKLSQRIAGNALAAALEMDAAGAEVVDITSWSFDPAARSSERNRTLIWTDATVRVVFTVA